MFFFFLFFFCFLLKSPLVGVDGGDNEDDGYTRPTDMKLNQSGKDHFGTFVTNCKCHEDGIGDLCKLDILVVVIYCLILLKVTSTLYPNSQLNQTVNIQSGLGLSRVHYVIYTAQFTESAEEPFQGLKSTPVGPRG